jgi:hypothetical protein
MIFHEFTDTHFPIFPFIARDFKGATRICTSHVVFLWSDYHRSFLQCSLVLYSFLRVIDTLENKSLSNHFHFEGFFNVKYHLRSFPVFFTCLVLFL